MPEVSATKQQEDNYRHMQPSPMTLDEAIQCARVLFNDTQVAEYGHDYVLLMKIAHMLHNEYGVQ